MKPREPQWHADLSRLGAGKVMGTWGRFDLPLNSPIHTIRTKIQGIFDIVISVWRPIAPCHRTTMLPADFSFNRVPA